MEKEINILALDLGTSALKTIIANQYGELLYKESLPYPTTSPHKGWVQQDPYDWISVLSESLHSIPINIKSSIAAITFSGHMSSILLVDNSGKPLTQCLTLTDSRGACFLDSLSSLQNYISTIGGTPLSANSWILKALWLLNQTNVNHEALKFQFAKDFLRLFFTGKIATEYTDAGNTGLMSFSTRQWDKKALKQCNLSYEIFPEIHSPFEVSGYILEEIAVRFNLPKNIPIFYGAADMACAASGCNISEDNNNLAITLGSSATMLQCIDSNTFIKKGIGKLSFHPHILPNVNYALGSHYTGGTGVNWFTGMLNGHSLTPNYDEITSISSEASIIPVGSNGIIAIPFLTGSGSPHNNGSDSAAFLGLNLSSSRGALFHALLEGISFNLYESYLIFKEMIDIDPYIFLGGGGINIHLWPKIIADVFGKNLFILDTKDASAIGAVMLAAYGLGLIETPYYNSKIIDEVSFSPSNHSIYMDIFNKYKFFYSLLTSNDFT